MESTRSQPMLISNGVNETFNDQCCYDDNCGEWQDLEQFWGDEKQRLQDLDGQAKQLSSSLEEHLLHDDFLKEPGKESSLDDERYNGKIVKGEDVSDIPTTYIAKGFKSHELIVIGTYVHNDIIPGFLYKVRKNLTDEYLFEGSAKYLESIGLGYGKRLTFEGETLNENENYFWSDSSVHGYGFTFQAVRNEDIFSIFDTKTGQVIGRVIINDPSLTEDTVLATTVGELGYVEKEVEVHFSCDVILNDRTNGQNLFVQNIPVRGKAIVIRESSFSKAKANQIFLDEFIIDSCLLVPEE